jgi:predicted heme/steroid binding protein
MPKGIIDSARVRVDSSIVQAISIGKSGKVFIAFSGQLIDVEQGEAGDDAVVQTQGGSLIYYSIMVNDVYAYFLTAVKDGAFGPAPANFPTTNFELKKIMDFARAHSGGNLPDSVALAVELKASWVEASTLSDPAHYIQVQGTIPVYDKSNPQHWVKTGEHEATLALVGLHVVASIANHPEMIWATFEHYENTPNGSYTYVNSSDAIVTQALNTTGNYLLCASGAAGPFNVQRMVLSSGDIVAAGGQTIGPSNTVRMKAFGNASDHFPNQEDQNVAGANTKIISINNSVHSQLGSGDVRGNYNFIGATWTFDGSPGNDVNGAGTSRLCNSTMETYVMGSNTLFANSGTCFSCHSSTGTNSSHIFAGIKPLF